MSSRRRGIGLTPMETRRDVIVQTAKLADELGFEVFAVAEGWGLDATNVLTEIATQTRRIKLVAGILSVWGRSAATLAMTAATLHQISEGRFILGLGASTRQLVEGFHDVPFVSPADQLRRVTTNVRTLLHGERIRLDDTRSVRPLRLGVPPAPDLPLWIAASGTHTVRVAAELADGWYPIYVARDRFSSWVAELNRVRTSAGQREERLLVAAGPFTVVADHVADARTAAAGCTAWYVTAMGDVYARLLSAQGFATEVQAVIAANPRPNLEHGVVPAEAELLLEQVAAWGTPSTVREQLELWDDAVDVVMVLMIPGLPWEAIEATVRTAAP